MDAVSRTPHALVLGGGGILGEAWMSALLAGLDEADGFDSRACAGYVGTSAGSIVAAALTAGVDPRARLGRLPGPSGAIDGAASATPLRQLVGAAAGLGGMAAAPLAALTLRTTAPAGAAVRRAALARVPAGRRSLGGLARSIDDSGAIWDGRLRVVAVELESGRRVVFGADGGPAASDGASAASVGGRAAPAASVGAAVEASCAIPGVFRPVRIGDRSYVDGGAWSPTNLDAVAAGRGDRVLCLNPTGSFRPTLASPAGALGPVSRGVAGAEALALRRRGVAVTMVNPDRASVEAMGTDLMNGSRRDAVIAAGLAQGRRLSTRAAV
jgi:NTE family protein